MYYSLGRGKKGGGGGGREEEAGRRRRRCTHGPSSNRVHDFLFVIYIVFITHCKVLIKKKIMFLRSRF